MIWSAVALRLFHSFRLINKHPVLMPALAPPPIAEPAERTSGSRSTSAAMVGDRLRAISAESTITTATVTRTRETADR
jgi:hypothetical protein